MNQSGEFEFCKEYMEDDEYILWEGKPERGLLADDIVPVMIICGGGCIAVGLLCAYVFSRSQMDTGTVLFFCFFCLLGFIFMVAQPLGKSSERKKMRYVIINKRILLKDGKKVFSFSGEDLPPMELYPHKNGNSTLSFGQVLYERDDDKVLTGSCRLGNLSDAERVKDALRTLRMETAGRTGQYNAPNMEPEEIEENHTISGQRFEQVTYDPTGHILDTVILRTYMDFPFSFNTINGRNDIHAVYRNLKFEMSDVQLETYAPDANGSMSYYCNFKGQWFFCRFNRKFPADLYLSVRQKDKRKKEDGIRIRRSFVRRTGI